MPNRSKTARFHAKYRRSDDGRYWVTRSWWNLTVGRWQSAKARRDIERERADRLGGRPNE